jgi:hypothetical protein
MHCHRAAASSAISRADSGPGQVLYKTRLMHCSTSRVFATRGTQLQTFAIEGTLVSSAVICCHLICCHVTAAREYEYSCSALTRARVLLLPDTTVFCPRVPASDQLVTRESVLCETLAHARGALCAPHSAARTLLFLAPCLV